ncbi:ABC transporter ATP-binding protein [Pectobacterium cacticida]|uniref:ABC transporter ATP-binding protein n=1 Tax=Pectobacterium cacticida TaxID=69221 RepID=UPI0039885113
MNHHLHAVPTPFLSLEHVSRYRQTSRLPWQKVDPADSIFHDLSLTMQQHERVGLVGASGCGKSTLLKTLLALEAPERGAVYCDGNLIKPGSVRSLIWYRRRVQYIPQDPAGSLAPHQRVADLLTEPLKRLRADGSWRANKNHSTRLHEVMDQVGLSTTLLSNVAGQLSGGQAQRVALARALMVQPAFLVADEPVSGLDLPLREQIKALLQQITEQNKMGLLMVSHDISILAGLCDRMLVMNDGCIIEDRPTAEVLASPQQAHTARLLQAVPALSTSGY